MVRVYSHTAILLTLLLLPAKSFSEPLDLMLQFGPFVGGGQASDDSRVRYANGMRTIADYRFARTNDWRWYSRIEMQNSLVNSGKTTIDEWQQITVHDYRLIALGAKVAHEWRHNGESKRDLYLATTVGGSFAKLNLDRNQQDSFLQHDLRGMRGVYLSVEAGAHVHLEPNFALTFSATLAQHRLNQRSGKGTYSGEVRDGELRLVSGEIDATGSDIPSDLKQSLIMINLGLAFLL